MYKGRGSDHGAWWRRGLVDCEPNWWNNIPACRQHLARTASISRDHGARRELSFWRVEKAQPKRPGHCNGLHPAHIHQQLLHMPLKPLSSLLGEERSPYQSRAGDLLSHTNSKWPASCAELHWINNLWPRSQDRQGPGNTEGRRFPSQRISLAMEERRWFPYHHCVSSEEPALQEMKKFMDTCSVACPCTPSDMQVTPLAQHHIHMQMHQWWHTSVTGFLSFQVNSGAKSKPLS